MHPVLSRKIPPPVDMLSLKKLGIDNEVPQVVHPKGRTYISV
ncbi:unnamed protein product [Spirodela intermedia]|uniref:Uncharacterized protein n=1 Tax=Spirodela intermedia TaxID=51605 RepID=A0A7I8KWH8_SPIIN|nr:unnamed protein product [Spirodela intermedia]